MNFLSKHSCLVTGVLVLLLIGICVGSTIYTTAYEQWLNTETRQFIGKTITIIDYDTQKLYQYIIESVIVHGGGSGLTLQGRLIYRLQNGERFGGVQITNRLSIMMTIQQPDGSGKTTSLSRFTVSKDEEISTYSTYIIIEFTGADGVLP